MILEDGAAASGPVPVQPCLQCNLPIKECKCQASNPACDSGFDFSSIVDAGDVVVEVASEIVGGIFGSIFD